MAKHLSVNFGGKHSQKSTSTSLPQLTLFKQNVKSMRQRNAPFRRAKKSGNPLHFAKFKLARNKVVSDMHCAKAEYFRRLNPSNSDQFWKSLKYLNKQSSFVPTLNILNIALIQKKPTYWIPILMNALITLFLQYPHYHLMMKVYTHAPPDILCTAKEVQHMLQKLDTAWKG